MAAGVSRLGDAVRNRFEGKALSLLATSFGRHPKECRNGITRVAEFCRDESEILQDLSGQNLSLLMSGLSKWPEEQACGEAAAAISLAVLEAGRVHRFDAQALAILVNGFSKWPEQTRDAAVETAGMIDVNRLGDFEPQHLANLVNGFSKWPDQPACQQAIVNIAHELVRCRASKLSHFSEQHLANLVNGFSKSPDVTVHRNAAGLISGELCSRAARPPWLGGFTAQGLANVMNGFTKWPDSRAAVAIAGEVCRRGKCKCPAKLADFVPQDLASLVNGISKWPGEPNLKEAAETIAREVLRHARDAPLSRFSSQDLANLVNGFSKFPHSNDCCQATISIARNIDPARVLSFAPQQLMNLVNGFSKWPGAPECRQATVEIGREVRDRAASGRLSEFTRGELASLINGLSKWPDEIACRQAALAVAANIHRFSHSGHDYRDLANLVNAFSKWPLELDSVNATLSIARIVVDIADQLPRFHQQQLANLVNGFSKWPLENDCQHAARLIAAEVRGRADRDERLADVTRQGLANLANAFSKWPQEDFGKATVAVAGALCSRADQLPVFTRQELANLVNGFSKVPEEESCLQGVRLIAAELCQRAADDGGLPDFAPQGLASLANGLSKWPQEQAGREATVQVAAEISHRATLADGLSRFTSQELANLVNGFSKWPTGDDTGRATEVIAREVHERSLASFASQELANLVNGFSKCLDEEASRQAVLDIARTLGAGAHRFSALTMSELSMVANALGRSITVSEDSGEITHTTLLRDRFSKLAHHLHYANDRLKQADVRSIANIFKALGKARLVDDLGLLARAGLDRIEELRQGPNFAAANDLETIGNLSVAVLPLARGSQRQLRWHRRQALHLLNDIQGVVKDKITAHLAASDAERIRGPHASRCPALSMYQVLKARAVLETLYRRPYIEGKMLDLKARQQELQRETRDILHRTRELIERDLSNMSWNLIADIETERPLEALDSFLAANTVTVQANRPASQFNVHQVLREMDHEPRPPQGKAGLMRLPVVDLQGRPVATEPETRYSIFHRVTEGRVPVVAVQLPSRPSAFMLARTLTVEGVPYRMDLFGGSKLKPPRSTLAQIAARVPGAASVEPPGGKLLAIPYAETAAGTDFERLSRAWAPFKEAYFYTQRRGFAAPLAIKGLGPHDAALEGTFRLALLPDRPAGEAHPFRLSGAQGGIALRPHDGCGFIKTSLATRMPAVRRVGDQDNPERVPAFGEGRRASLPASALQHYPRSEEVAAEARKMASNWLAGRDEQELNSEDLYRTVTGGHIDGPGAVAVPSSDGRLHVPTLKSESMTGTQGVLIGRSPYDKPNLRPFATAQVGSSADGDPTAIFLDQCVAIQYSFNVAQKSSGELAADDPMLFAKGILIVVPDEMWPAAFADRGLVLSAEDVKCHSHWARAKDRAKVDTLLDCVGILQATEVFAPGSLVAVPPVEQKKLDGDFDGDAVIIVADRPQLYQHVRQFDQAEQARGVHSLKPPKSHTPAIEGEHYQFSRASQILAATQNVLETYTGLQRDFLAQSQQARRWFAERAIFGIYEGIHHELRRELQVLLTQDEVSREQIEHSLEKAGREIEVADHPVAREVAELLMADLEAWAAQPRVLPATAEGGNDARRTVSADLCELLPDLAEAYPATAQPRERIQLIVDNYPARIHPRPDGYVADDHVQSANNLLSVGIKVGTDAYKSDTGACLFAAKSRQLLYLLQKAPGLSAVPYTKGIAARLKQGRLDVDATLADLKDNPTLTASIMEASIKLAAERGILSEQSDRWAASAGPVTTLAGEQANERAHIEAENAKVEENAITATLGEVAERLRTYNIEVSLPHHDRRLRSEASMRDQLTGMSVPSAQASQLISNAVRHVFEIPDRDFTAAFRKAVLVFEDQGYTEVSTTNWFKKLNPTFIGITTVFATPRGYRFEVEFHTPSSYKAKIANHHVYKMLQRGPPGISDQSRAEELLQHARTICKDVAIPDGVTDIPHWDIDTGSTAGSMASAVRAALPRIPKRSPMAGQIVAALGDKSVVLVGMMGAGKSSIGKKLSNLLGLKFFDSDQVIKDKTGAKSINKIWENQGEGYFRELEEKQIPQLLAQGPMVLATGGGSFINDRTRNCIAQNAISIWIDADLDMIMRHLPNDTSRPLLQTEDPKGAIQKLMNQRQEIYAQAQLRISPIKWEINKSAAECLNKLHDKLCADVAEPGAPADRGAA
ncbi:shikimate kinase [Mesorhizobium sp. PL10]